MVEDVFVDKSEVFLSAGQVKSKANTRGTMNSIFGSPAPRGLVPSTEQIFPPHGIDTFGIEGHPDHPDSHGRRPTYGEGKRASVESSPLTANHSPTSRG